MTSDSWPGRIELNPGSPATVTLVDGQGKDLGTFDSPEEAIASMPGAAPEAGPTAQSKAVRLSLTNGRALACGTHAGYGTLPTAHPATRRCQRCANTTPATTEEKPHVPDV